MTAPKDIIDQIDEAILAPEAPVATVVPNDMADSITVTVVPTPAKKAPAAKKAAPKPAAKAPARAPGKAVAKAPVIEGEVVTVLDKAKAEALDKKIGTTLEGIEKAVTDADNRVAKLAELVHEAEVGQIHVNLGFDSWTAWLEERVTIPMASINERRQVISALHDAGLSQRAIATMTNVSPATVNLTIKAINEERPADAEKPAATTTDKRGRVHSREKASAAGKKAAGAKKPAGKKADSGRATGKPISPRALGIGEVATWLENTHYASFQPGEINNIRRIVKAAEKILREHDVNANNNKNAKA